MGVTFFVAFIGKNLWGRTKRSKVATIGSATQRLVMELHHLQKLLQAACICSLIYQ